MVTVAQRRKRAKMFKAGAVMAMIAIVFTPRFDDFDFPDVGFPLITTAVAAPLN